MGDADAYVALLEDGSYREASAPGEQVQEADRVCWAEAVVTIPAGERCTLTAMFRKAPHETYGMPLLGFDVAPWLDTNLTYTAQQAALMDRGRMELVEQNFGFDPENGVNTVDLEKAVPQYYLKVLYLEGPAADGMAEDP